MSKLMIVAIVALQAGLPSAAYALEGDADAGEKVFKKCLACHNVENDKRKVGPSLMGVIGRTPGTHDDFKYSDAMIEYGKDHVWDEATLTTYLADPRGIVKGTKMAFPGLKKEQDIADVIAYLKKFSDPQ